METNALVHRDETSQQKYDRYLGEIEELNTDTHGIHVADNRKHRRLSIPYDRAPNGIYGRLIIDAVYSRTDKSEDWSATRIGALWVPFDKTERGYDVIVTADDAISKPETAEANLSVIGRAIQAATTQAVESYLDIEELTNEELPEAA